MYTDDELIEGCLRGKRAFQRHLYDKYSVKMLGVCMRYIRIQEEAEDVLQDGFVKVFLNLHTFRHKGSLEGWIRKIFVTTALLQIRGRIRMQTGREDEIQDACTNEDTDHDDPWLNQLSSEQLFGIIHTLPDGYRTVFLLYAVDGYGHKEIAGLLGITEGTSKSQLSRARMLLKEKIRGHCLKEKPVING